MLIRIHVYFNNRLKISIVKKIFWLCLLGVMAVSACNKSDNNDGNTIPTASLEGKIKLLMDVVSGIKVTLWSDSSLSVGYNKLYFTLEDSVSGQSLTDVSPVLSAKMDMDGMMMSGPCENPEFKDDLKGYEGASVFTMPGNDMMGKWVIMLAFENPNTGRDDTATFSVEVKSAGFGTVLTQKGNDSAQYLITLIQPLHPQIGMNNMELLICKQSDNSMSYVPENDLTIEAKPQMPSMGGMTSTGNENPAFTANGHYLGKVNLNMTGDWQIDLKIHKGGALILDNAHFNFTF